MISFIKKKKIIIKRTETAIYWPFPSPPTLLLPSLLAFPLFVVLLTCSIFLFFLSSALLVMFPKPKTKIEGNDLGLAIEISANLVSVIPCLFCLNTPNQQLSFIIPFSLTYTHMSLHLHTLAATREGAQTLQQIRTSSSSRLFAPPHPYPHASSRGKPKLAYSLRVLGSDKTQYIVSS